MAKTEHFYTEFEPELFYHLYNRAVNKKPLFTRPENCAFFLRRYEKYISPVATTYSYALCKNHFHFGIRVKPITELISFAAAAKLLGRFETVHDLVSEQFRRLFISYAKAFNKQQARVGGLFQTPFKRCLVDTEAKQARMLFYHHANPQRHKICKDFRKYPWTSYARYLQPGNSNLPREEVFDWFGGRENFIELHRQEKLDLQWEDDWWIEG